jgi:uncharacterized cofD-like protein
MSAPFARGRWSQLLRPGLHIKRWLLLLLVGITTVGLGLTLLLQQWSMGEQLPLLAHYLTLRFLPDWARGLVLVVGGLFVTGLAVWYLNRSVVTALLPGSAPPGSLEMVNLVLARQRRRQGPRIVAIGGGTGMPQLLRGLRGYTDNLTAIVTVADDGGSSGRLRRQLGMLPPGDFRNNIAALSEAEDLMTRLFQYRFAEREVADTDAKADEPAALAGHNFGNLFITTMAAVTGSFESGIAESSRVLAVRGRVVPSTLEQITLCAEICRTLPATADEPAREEWLIVEGESKIPAAHGRIMRVFLKPEHARAYPLAIQAILQADLIVAGPGSFFTSVMPNLLVPAIRDALNATAASRVYICNITTQPGETDGFSVGEHMRQLHAHVGDAFPNVLANDNFTIPLQTDSPYVGEWVRLPADDEARPYRLFTGDLIERGRPWRHDPAKLATRLMEVYAVLQGDK